MTANNGPARCRWANTKNQLYIDYHDNEWGEESRDCLLYTSDAADE